MITYEEFEKIRSGNHLLVLDTNVLLELYRWPACVSKDLLFAFKEVMDHIFIPRTVYEEYQRNRDKVKGDAKEKYKRVGRDLENIINELDRRKSAELAQHQKHRYQDIAQLDAQMSEKIQDIRALAKIYKEEHADENRENEEFLNRDEVNTFVENALSQNHVGEDFTLKERIDIYTEGEIRYKNEIPPGYLDSAKDSSCKYGDLFVWKSILKIAKQKKADIIFICNDQKEDWWEKTKKYDVIDLRKELQKEFAEENPTLQVKFLTLETFFNYVEEELQLSNSLCSLRLAASKDTEKYLEQHKEEINREITEVIQKEYDQVIPPEHREHWKIIENDRNGEIRNVRVSRDGRNIIYDIDILVNVYAEVLKTQMGREKTLKNINMTICGKVMVNREVYSKETRITHQTWVLPDGREDKKEITFYIKDTEAAQRVIETRLALLWAALSEEIILSHNNSEPTFQVDSYILHYEEIGDIVINIEESKIDYEKRMLQRVMLYYIAYFTFLKH